MVRMYGTSLCGTAHAKDGRSCEDAHGYKQLKNEWVFACVADGVGNAGRGGEGARTAVDAAMRFVDTVAIDVWSDEDLLSVMRGVFLAALCAVTKYAREQNAADEQFDTTFTAVLYLGVKTVVGHSGDGGVIGLNLVDDCVALTSRQQQVVDGFAYVIPLRYNAGWKFAVYDQPMKAVLLATDGIYDKIASKSHDVDPLAVWCYMQPRSIDEKTDEDLKQMLEENLSASSYDCVGDDKTVVVLIDDTQPHTEYDEAKAEAYLRRTEEEEQRIRRQIYTSAQSDASEKTNDLQKTLDVLHKKWDDYVAPVLQQIPRPNTTDLHRAAAVLRKTLRNGGNRYYEIISRRKGKDQHQLEETRQQVGSSEQE